MLDVLLDALLDTAKILPFLFVAYILIEVISYYFSDKLNNAIFNKFAPFFGGLLGIIPQCGFSVLSAEVYARRFITIGTLFAVFLATSDEAFVIMIANPDGLKAILPVILIKFVSAVIIGTLIDVIFSKRNKALREKAEKELEEMQKAEEQQQEENLTDEGNQSYVSCGCSSCAGSSKWQIFLLSPFLHSLKIIAFIFVINFLFGTLMYFVGEENVANFLQSSQIFGPVLSALVGLIPNCASSVIITELYLNGALNFASLVAGLCANVGIASVILFKNLKIKETVLILVSLFAISVVIGYLLMAFKISF